MTEKRPRLAKIDEAACFLNVSRRTIYRLIDDGTIVPTRLRENGHLRIPWSVLKRLAKATKLPT